MDVPTKDIDIRPAIANDAAVLTALTLTSKAHWGYSNAEIESWRDMLTITPAYIEQHSVFVATVLENMAGYYSWIQRSSILYELDNMFIAPAYIGRGIGKQLMSDFLFRMQSKGSREILIYSDPHAAAFYRKYGFETIREEESNIKGRYLPVMKKEMP